MDASQRGSILLGALVVVVLVAYLAMGAIFYAGFSKAEATDRRIEQLVDENRRMILERARVSCNGSIENRALLIGFVDSLVATAQADDEENGESTRRAEEFREAERLRILGSGVPPQCDGVMSRDNYVREVDEGVERQARGSTSAALASVLRDGD